IDLRPGSGIRVIGRNAVAWGRRRRVSVRPAPGVGGGSKPIRVEGKEYATCRPIPARPGPCDAGCRRARLRGRSGRESRESRGSSQVTITSALALEDGSVFRGTPFGAAVEARAEVVFNTCMTGYQ